MSCFLGHVPYPLHGTWPSDRLVVASGHHAICLLPLFSGAQELVTKTKNHFKIPEWYTKFRPKAGIRNFKTKNCSMKTAIGTFGECVVETSVAEPVVQTRRDRR